MIHKYLTVLSIATALIFTACGGDDGSSKKVDKGEKKEPSEKIKYQIDKTQQIIRAVPMPREISKLLKDAGAQYNYKLLNDLKLLDDYESTKSRAINLGVYGADLNYALVFDETGETMLYFRCTEKLMEDLDINNVITEEVIERAETQIDMGQTDSVLDIASEMFNAMDLYLTENNRKVVSGLVIAGGWIEGMYIATQIANSNLDNTEIAQRVAEQKVGLHELVDLLVSYEDQALVADVLADLQALKTDFEGVVFEHTNAPPTKEDGQVVLGGETKTEITPEQLQTIIANVAALRAKYTQ